MLIESFQQSVESRTPEGGFENVGRRDPPQTQTHALDDSRQSHSAAGGVKQVRVLRKAGAHALPIAQQQFKVLHMCREASIEVMVLAMDVARDRATDTDKARAW